MGFRGIGIAIKLTPTEARSVLPVGASVLAIQGKLPGGNTRTPTPWCF